MGINVDIEREKLGDYPESFRRSQQKRMMRAATIGFQWSQEQAPEDRGTLKQTAVDPEFVEGGTKVRWGYTQPYARDQEFGTKPFEPDAEEIPQILDWSERVSGSKELGWKLIEHIFPEKGIEEKRFARAGRDRQIQAFNGKSFSEIFEDELG